MASTDDTAAEKSRAETKKLTEEIKSLRLQRTIAILTAVGGFLGFAITNSTQISTLFTRKPQVFFATADEFVKRNGRVEITTRSGKDPAVLVNGSFPDLQKRYNLDPGPYRFAVRVQGD